MTVRIEDVTCVAETAKAILVEGPNIEGQVWVPLSHVHEDSEVYKRDTSGTFIVTDWIAQQKGWGG